MTERNLCKETGCVACCHDMRMTMPSTSRQKYYPDAKAILPDNANESYPDGVYWYHKGYVGTTYFVYVKIVGMCPHNVDGECSIHINRPLVCSKFLITSDDCNKLRVLDGHQTIRLEDIK